MSSVRRGPRFGSVAVALTCSWIAACEATDVETKDDAAQEGMAQVGAGAHTHPDRPADCETFDSSFAAIQKLVFERRGCTESACHGQAKVGGLDLRADVSYENLVDVASTNSKNARVQPGTAIQSYLYQKLQAATHPGSVEIAGSPMPVGAPPLSENELQAVQLWIQKGAPEVGSVGDATKNLDVGKLLDACLPPLAPVKIKPLDPPAPSEGVQMRMPVYVLKGNTEVEHCTPFVYDFTNQVPARFKDEARNVMYVNSSRVRQDPQSHHLVVWNPKQDLTSIKADGTPWRCRGGWNDGNTCDPKLGSADCSEGVCAGKTNPGTTCGATGGDVGGALAGIDITALADPAKRAELLKDPAIAKALQDAARNGTLGGLSSSIVATQ